jgi:hypothetical protein
MSDSSRVVQPEDPFGPPTEPATLPTEPARTTESAGTTESATQPSEAAQPTEPAAEAAQPPEPAPPTELASEQPLPSIPPPPPPLPSPAAGASRGRRRWLPTLGVAGVIAAVVLGGFALDSVVAAPSAGTQVVGGSVTITASPGWVLAPSGESDGLVLQKGDATLSAQVLAEYYTGSSSSILEIVRRSLDSEVAQISYGDEHNLSVAGNDTTYVSFEAVVARSQGGQGGIVDGQLVCMVVSTDAVVVEVGAPQGHLDYVTDDVAEMIKTIRVAR